FGVLLLAGAATRLVAAAAGAFLFTLWISELGTAWVWELGIPVILAFCLAWARAGRTCGVDAVLARRYPGWRLGVALQDARRRRHPHVQRGGLDCARPRRNSRVPGHRGAGRRCGLERRNARDRRGTRGAGHRRAAPRIWSRLPDRPRSRGRPGHRRF